MCRIKTRIQNILQDVKEKLQIQTNEQTYRQILTPKENILNTLDIKKLIISLHYFMYHLAPSYQKCLAAKLIKILRIGKSLFKKSMFVLFLSCVVMSLFV